MDIKNLEGKLVAVLGYGMEGRSVAKYLLRHGIQPTLFDQKPWEEWRPAEREAVRSLGVNFIFGPDYLEELKGFDVIFRSPGIRLSDIQKKSGKAIITSQTKWFFEHCPAKIIGVTGTKGKGTTASLIFEVLKEQYQISNVKFQKPYLSGNIGKEQPLELLDDLKKNDWIIYELSSFQLQDLRQSPHISVVLMVTSEHLDYHSDVNEYKKAKSAITKFQKTDDMAVVNIDYPVSVEIGKLGGGGKIYFSAKKTLESGCYIENDQIVVKNISGQNFQFSISNVQLKGRHNWENICAAVATVAALDVDGLIIKQAVKNFKGLEHRLEFVAEKNGIKFYNDSFSTTPETAIAAILAFTEPEVVILGGSSKNSQFGELGKIISTAENIRALILIGEEGPRIRQAISANERFTGKILEGANNMKQIFDQVKNAAKSGDVVLLSPACASFGMFANYKERGRVFKEEAEKY